MLIAIDFEEPIEGPKSVLKRGQTFYIAQAVEVPFFWYIGSLEETVHREWHEVTTLAREKGGVFSFVKNKAKLPPSALTDVYENGASYMSNEVYP